MSRKRVLIVDDDVYYLHLLEFVVRKIVEQTDITVQYALSGEEALGMLGEGCFASLITDLNMPAMNGYELALKAKKMSPGLDIVMVTNDISPDVPELAARAGISRVFAKPYDDGQIREIVLGETGGNSLFGQAATSRPFQCS